MLTFEQIEIEREVLAGMVKELERLKVAYDLQASAYGASYREHRDYEKKFEEAKISFITAVLDYPCPPTPTDSWRN